MANVCEREKKTYHLSDENKNGFSIVSEKYNFPPNIRQIVKKKPNNSFREEQIKSANLMKMIQCYVIDH